MGRASISIAITSNFDPKGIDSAIAKMEKLAVQATSLHGKFGKELVNSGAQLGVASSYLEKWGKSIADVGDRLTAGVTVPMGIAAGAAIKCAMDIDTAWYNVRKTVDMTEEGYQELKRGAMELSSVQPVSAETILNIEALGGQLGITNESLESFAKTVSGLDIATNLSADEAATQLAQLRNITQMSEADLDNFASTLVDLGNHTATTESDIMQLALRFASAGHVAGMSNQDILGLSASLAGLGMKADAGGSALSQVINKISLDVAKGGEGVQKWADLVGEAPDKFAEAWRKAPTDQFVKVLKAIAADGADANEILNDLGITQIRQSDAMRRLASSGDLVTDSIKRANQAWKENTALDREVSNRNESIASQFETIKNRITNAAATFGEPIARMTLQALDAIDPLIGGLQNLGNAFAQADPHAQQFAFNLGAVAMSAGPVLSITGRLMQVVGKFGKSIGRAMQQYGVYTEALNTNDVALMRNYAEQDTLATRMGLSRNAAVKAAGGIDEFTRRAAAATVAVKEEAESAEMGRIFTEAYTRELQKEGTTNAKAMKIAKQEVATRKSKQQITKAGTEAVKELNAAEIDGVLATQRGKQALKEQGDAAKTSASALTSLKGVLLGLGGMAATAAIGAGVVAFATACQEAAERSATLDQATRGLRETAISTSVQLGTMARAAEDTGKSAGLVSQEIDKAIQSQAQLADTISNTNTQASAQIGDLNRAWQTIDQFANKSGLGASEHYRLEQAIQAVNEACGTQYSVMDDGTNRIQDETGAILENTDAIRENIEQRKQQIKLQSMEANLSGLYEQQIRNEQAIADAWAAHGDKLKEALPALQRIREIQGELSGITDTNSQRYQELNAELGTLVGKLDPTVQDFLEIRGAQDSLNETIRRTESEYEALTGATVNVGTALQEWVTQNDRLRTWFADVQGGVEGFAAACEDAGLNTIQLSQMSDSALSAIRDSYDGTKESIINALRGIGSEGEAILSQLPQNWRDSMSGATQGVIDAITQMGTYSLTQLRDLSMQFGIEGEGMTRAFMEALRNGLNPQEAANLANRLHQEFGNALSPDKAAQAVDAYMRAIEGHMSQTDAIQAAIDAIKSALGLVNFEQEGSNAGLTFFAGLNNSIQQGALDANTIWSDTGRALGRILPDGTVEGIGEGSVNIPNAVQGMVDGAKPGLDSLAPYALQSGTNAGLGFDSGLSIGGQGVGGTASGMIASLMGILTGGVGQAQGIGSDTGSSYGTGVGNQGGTAEYAAMQTLGRLLIIWLTGIASAQQAGARTGQAYSQGLASSAMPGVQFVQAAVQTIVSLMNAGVGPATAAGQAMGSGFGQSLSQMMLNAATFTQAAMASIVSIMRAGVAPATAAGRSVGTGFRSGLQAGATPAISVARAISVSAGSAFGAGRGAAAAGGSALGSAFAAAVRSSAQAAVGYAQSIRAQVQSIFDSIPTTKTVTLNVKTNVQKVAKAAALPSQTPAFQLGPGGTIAPFAGATRAAATAERAAQRIRATREANGAGATLMNVATGAVRSSGATVDYGTLQRVVRSGVMEAIRDSGGLSPAIQLDGKTVSRQLAPHMDYELGRLDRMRG